MPFTIAHAAVAWPFRRVAPSLPFAALVIGAMSPDYEFWFRLSPTGRVVHSIVGVFVFCVPVSLAIWVCFNRLLRPAMLDVLPPRLAATVPPPQTGFLAGTTAITLAALSHWAWDGFTHLSDWGVVMFPALEAEVRPGLAWYSLLQHASSVLGLAFILTASWRWLHAQPASVRAFEPGRGARLGRAAAIVVGAASAGLISNGWRGVAAGKLRVAVGLAAVGAMVGATVGLLAVAGLYWRREGNRVS